MVKLQFNIPTFSSINLRKSKVDKNHKTEIIKLGAKMYPILFSIGKVHIYNHGLFMVIGATLGGLLVWRMAKIKAYNTSFLFDILVYGFIGGLIGARVLYVILYFNQFASTKEMFFVWYGGLVSYGGMLGGLLIAYLILKKKQRKYL